MCASCELEKQTALAQAIVTLGRLLPQGMEVRFYREPGDPRTVVESTYENGEVTHHRFTEAMH